LAIFEKVLGADRLVRNRQPLVQRRYADALPLVQRSRLRAPLLFLPGKIGLPQ